MITQEFREWVKNIEIDVKNCLKNLADVELEEYGLNSYPFVVRITVKSNGFQTHMAFDQSEYDNNDEGQRHKLVESRCHDVAWSIGCEVDELKKIMKALQA